MHFGGVVELCVFWFGFFGFVCVGGCVCAPSGIQISGILSSKHNSVLHEISPLAYPSNFFSISLM